MFSVLFTTLDIDTSSSINYTMSNVDSMTLNGCWANVTYNIVGRKNYETGNESATIILNFTTFIA